MDTEERSEGQDAPESSTMQVTGDAADQELGRLWVAERSEEERAEEAADREAAVPDDGPAKIWTDVPHGAVLNLRVVSQNPSAAAIARLSTLDGRVELWPHQSISPGPKLRPLSSADSKYVLNVIVAFDRDHPGKVGIVASAIVQGTALKTYFHAVGGTRGEIKLGRVLIDMV
jgi:hypothetical protein